MSAGIATSAAEGPRYAQVETALRDAIGAGRFQVGAALPTEAELCREFAVSRHTVREALRRLADLGLVSRRQGSGTQVIAAEPPTAYVHSLRSLRELAQYARDTRLMISDIRAVVIGADETAIIPAPVGSRWMRVEGVRWDVEHTRRICATTVFAHMRFAPLLEEAPGYHGPIYELIERRSGERIYAASQDVTAHLLTRPVATLLAVPPGSPAFRFVRRYLDVGGNAMATSINWHAAEGFTYSTSLRLDGG